MSIRSQSIWVCSLQLSESRVSLDLTARSMSLPLGTFPHVSGSTSYPRLALFCIRLRQQPQAVATAVLLRSLVSSPLAIHPSPECLGQYNYQIRRSHRSFSFKILLIFNINKSQQNFHVDKGQIYARACKILNGRK